MPNSGSSKSNSGPTECDRDYNQKNEIVLSPRTLRRVEKLDKILYPEQKRNRSLVNWLSRITQGYRKKGSRGVRGVRGGKGYGNSRGTRKK
jgi:hypothetical protein